VTDEEKIDWCRTAVGEIDILKARVKGLGEQRRQFMRELHESGHGLGELAKALGVTKARVQQLCR
jgi:hypothetical protein